MREVVPLCTSLTACGSLGPESSCPNTWTARRATQAMPSQLFRWALWRPLVGAIPCGRPAAAAAFAAWRDWRRRNQGSVEPTPDEGSAIVRSRPGSDTIALGVSYRPAGRWPQRRPGGASPLPNGGAAAAAGLASVAPTTRPPRPSGGRHARMTLRFRTADSGQRTADSAHRTPHTAHRTPHTAHRTPHTAHRTPHTGQMRSWGPNYGASGRDVASRARCRTRRQAGSVGLRPVRRPICLSR